MNEQGQRVRRVGLNGDGQIGHMVEMEDGRQGVKLDRGTGVTSENIVVPYRKEQWEPVEEPRLQAMQIARVAFVADRALRLGRGEYGVAEWDSLRESPRVDWLRNGPPKEDDQRRRLYAAILGALTK